MTWSLLPSDLVTLQLLSVFAVFSTAFSMGGTTSMPYYTPLVSTIILQRRILGRLPLVVGRPHSIHKDTSHRRLALEVTSMCWLHYDLFIHTVATESCRHGILGPGFPSCTDTIAQFSFNLLIRFYDILSLPGAMAR